MARVHLLDDELINKIAAGEVVERPASVVKELVENAIDAGATYVKVILKDGGRQRIQVQDDGAGMSPEDAVLAVKRHTTSKLMAADDLFQVKTMGFRGEALASIASVSRFTLQTQAADQAGCRVTIEEGKQNSSPWQGPQGTNITVADLFYNVPARRSFMKTAAAEFACCHEYMQALALSLPQVGFTLLHNDREIFAVSPLAAAPESLPSEAAMRARAAVLLGPEDAARLLYVQHSDRHAVVEALISPPGLDKGTARYCFTFVNGRWVRDKLLRFAIQRGYHSHLMRGKFPIALLYLTIDPALVDVNVHPAKAELRFQYGQEVQNAVVYAIREGLRSGSWAGAEPLAKKSEAVPSEVFSHVDFDLLLPQKPLDLQPATEKASPGNVPLTRVSSTESSSSAKNSSAPAASAPAAREPAPSSGSAGPGTAVPKTEPFGSRAPAAQAKEMPGLQHARSVATPPRVRPEPFTPTLSTAKPAAETVTRTTMRFDTAAEQPKTVSPTYPLKKSVMQVPSPDGQSVIPWMDLQFVGPFARCFLLFEYQQQMLAIDQHAFHERILYERLVQDPDILRRTQPLLMPEVLAFSPTECERLVHMKDALAALGITIHGVSETEIEVTTVPSLLVNKDLGSLLAAFLGGKDSPQELAHDVLATMACHAAVRAGEELPAPEMKALLQEAESVDFYHNCPHGRRVFRWWKLAQVAAWFDR